MTTAESIAASLLGVGFDSVTGERRSTAVSGRVVNTGGKHDWHAEVCKGLSEVSKVLKINQSLSAGVVGVAEVNEKIKFVSDLKITEESLSIVVHAWRQAATATLYDPRLETALNALDAKEFARVYGDSYVNSVSVGGEYYAVYVFRTQSKEQRDSLEVSVRGSGVLKSVKADASFEMSMETIAKDTKTAWVYDQHMTGVSSVELPGHDTVIDFARKFSTLPLDSPVEVSKTTTGYENVKDFRIEFDTVLDNRDYFVGDGQPAGGLTKALMQIVSLQNRADEIKAIYHCYGYTGDGALDTFSDDLAADREAISAQFKAYKRNPTRAFTKPELPSLKKGTPKLSFTTGNSQIWGGPRGGEWGIGSVEKAVYSRLRLHSIRIFAWDYVDRLVLTYKDASGESVEQGFGAGNNHPQSPLIMAEDEFPKTFKVRAGEVIDRLEITTTKDHGTGPHHGGERGNPYEWTVPAGSVVIGLAGRAGKHIDQLQAITIKLAPAIMVGAKP